MAAENKNPFIIDPVSITINNSYDLREWEKKVIERCFHDNPSSSGIEISKRLGITDRALWRKIKRFGIKANFERGGIKQKAKH